MKKYIDEFVNYGLAPLLIISFYLSGQEILLVLINLVSVAVTALIAVGLVMTMRTVSRGGFPNFEIVDILEQYKTLKYWQKAIVYGTWAGCAALLYSAGASTTLAMFLVMAAISIYALFYLDKLAAKYEHVDLANFESEHFDPRDRVEPEILDAIEVKEPDRAEPVPPVEPGPAVVDLVSEEIPETTFMPVDPALLEKAKADYEQQMKAEAVNTVDTIRENIKKVAAPVSRTPKKNTVRPAAKKKADVATKVVPKKAAKKPGPQKNFSRKKNTRPE